MFQVGNDGPANYMVVKNTSIAGRNTIGNLKGSDIYYDRGHYYDPGMFGNFTGFNLSANLADNESSPVLVLVDKDGNILDWLTIYSSRTRYDDYFTISVFHEATDVNKTQIIDSFYNLNEGRIAFDIDVAEGDVPAVVRMADTGKDNELICEVPIKNPGKHQVLFNSLGVIRDINATVYSPSSGKVLSVGTTQGNYSSMFSQAHYLTRQNVSVVNMVVRKPVVAQVYGSDGNVIVKSPVFYPRQNFTWIIPFNTSEFQSIELIEDGRMVSRLTNDSFTMRTTSFPVDFFSSISEDDTDVFEAVYTIPDDYHNAEVVEFLSSGGNPVLHEVTPGQTYLYSRNGNITYGDYMVILIIEDGQVRKAAKSVIRSTGWGPEALSEKMSKTEIELIRNRAIRA
jgi:hypothetical protein